MQKLEQKGYSREEIIKRLHMTDGSNQIKFRYDLLDKNEQKIKELDGVLEAEVSMNALADIKRTARFKIKDDESIDWLNDRIQPFFMLNFDRYTPITDTVTTHKNIEWTEINNCTADGNNLSKLNGVEDWNAGAFGDILKSNGYIEMQLTAINGRRMFGLSNDKSLNYRNIDFGIVIYESSPGAINTLMRIVENNSVKYQRYIQLGDTLKIAVENGTVNYYRNNTLIYTSKQRISFPLYSCGLLYTVGATIQNTIIEKVETITNVQKTGEWLEWPLGIFLLSSPRRTEQNGVIYRDIEAYDGLQILIDDKFEDRYTINQGTNYIAAVTKILTDVGILKYNLEQTSKTLQITREWELGTTKLSVINELLQEIAYTSLWVDEYGFYTSSLYKIPSERPSEYTYQDNEISILCDGVSEELDLFSVHNKWVVVQSNAETAPLKSVKTNENPESITSYQSRGRWLVDYRTINNIADQASLDVYTQRLAFEDSQIYGHVSFETALMPMHSYFNVFNLAYLKLNINDKYTEMNWTMPLKAGQKMKHEVRKVISI